MSFITDSEGGQISGLLSGKRRWSAGTPPKDVAGWVAAALGASVLVIACTWKTLLDVRAAAVTLEIGGLFVDAVLMICGLAVLLLLLPGLRSLQNSRAAKAALASDSMVDARVANAASRENAYYTLGAAAAVVAVILLVQFVIANDLAVGRTFFLLPLIGSTFGLVGKAFWVNIYIFVVAEIFVLIWGLIVAVARLMPGKAWRPIRMMATIYTDVFRGLPAIINIYLIGFGLSLTGLPWVKDLSQETFAIIALTLTHGAYTAEIYRAGIESIHGSQVAAARSLGLTYFQTLRYVIVPQAVRRIIPPLLNGFIGLQKDTALVNVIGAVDAFNQAKILTSNYFNLSPVSGVAFLFILITIPQARLVDKLMERDQRRMRAGGN
ncbi:amino acid ABC transporter permease [Ochrobactrum vermis]|uniref:Amino acid ABC transporter permease n=1 Tax=Ochrobactrum vermis TaxID=1827297 RepID=A0ABU8PGY4_9HYPH|nr:amino acid ABC transporter permease [Ochrobactrum vermis]PQZ25865.1 polar amino acid ABC transporter permease [Ochrobactrum vermis]